ncbi:MAG: zinc metalloprotease, partial [Chitinophagaceae bacterium]
MLSSLIRILLIIVSFSSLSSFSNAVFAQNDIANRCGTVELLQQRIKRDPTLKARIQQQDRQLRQSVLQRSNFKTDIAPVIIPVVFHIVMTNPSLVTDAQIMAQMDTLNNDYSGSNGDSVKIPSYFKPLFGKTAIRFVLAQRTPGNEVTNGIDRVTTSVTSFNVNNVNTVKHSLTGGTEAWNTSGYLNVWVCSLSGGLLGIATFPDDGVPEEQGVVIHYSSVPGSAGTNFNRGKTLTHEVGHYFNLYHIWGDDDGACTGTDQVDDTPNQGNFTSGCKTGVITDNCSMASPGVMYQNYMDYTYDECMVMFTAQQAVRMEASMTNFRSSLYNSIGGVPLVRFDRDADLRMLTSPQQRLCTSG